MSPTTTPPWAPTLRWLALAAVVFVADQVTKHAILASFRPGEALPVTPFFSLVLAFNPGAAFSFLARAQGWQTLFTNLSRISDVCKSKGVTAVLHPHWGTMVQNVDEVERVLELCRPPVRASGLRVRRTWRR